MNDDIQRAYDRLTSAISPPADARERVAARATQRRRRRTSALAALAVAAVAGVGGVATMLDQEDQGRDPGVAGSMVVSCPQGEAETSAATGIPRVPAFESPADAAHGWAGPGAGTVTVSDDKRYAYLLREDGSIRARMSLASTRSDLDDNEPTSWSVDGSVACSDEVSAEPWDGAASLACADGVVRARVDYPPRGDRRALIAEEAARVMSVRRDDSVTVALTLGARSGDITATLRTGSSVHTAVRVMRVADTWRVVQLAACAGELPGLPDPGKEATVVPLFVGHCWIDPLAYEGKLWEAPDDQQFGSGGGMPGTWRGLGTIQESDDGLSYVDIGGTRLTLLPPGSPGVSDKTLCA